MKGRHDSTHYRRYPPSMNMPAWAWLALGVMLGILADRVIL